MTLLFGLAALAILLWAAQKYLQADPRKLAAVLKLSGGIALLGFAAFLALRGQIGVAAPLAAVGLGLLGWLPFGPAGFGARTHSRGGVSSLKWFLGAEPADGRSTCRSLRGPLYSVSGEFPPRT